MPLRTNSLSMRNIPEGVSMKGVQPLEQQNSGFSSWVQSLPEDSKGNLNPSDPKHREYIGGILSAVESGQATIDDVNKLAQRNKTLAPLLYGAYGNYQRAKQQGQMLSPYFEPGRNQDMSGEIANDQSFTGTPVIEPKSDYKGAIAAANKSGMVDLADKLVKQQKDSMGEIRAPTAQELGIKASGGVTQHPIVERMTPDDAKRALGESQEATSDVALSHFSKGALLEAAKRYNIDGTLPTNLGRSQSSVTGAVLNLASELSKGTGDQDARITQLSNKASATGLSQISKQEAMVGAFEKTFNKNADLVIQQSQKVDRTGSPVINRWLLAGKKSIAGDPDVASFDLLVKAAVNEYTKIISGSMGNTVMAEGEIKKVEGLLNSAQTDKQIIDVVKYMRKETGNRMAGFTEQKSQIRNNMRSSNNQSNTSNTSNTSKTIKWDDLK